MMKGSYDIKKFVLALSILTLLMFFIFSVTTTSYAESLNILRHINKTLLFDDDEEDDASDIGYASLPLKGPRSDVFLNSMLRQGLRNASLENTILDTGNNNPQEPTPGENNPPSEPGSGNITKPINIEPITRPIETITKPIETVTKPTNTEPIQRIIEPITKPESEPIQRIIEPIQRKVIEAQIESQFNNPLFSSQMANQPQEPLVPTGN